MCVGNNYLFFSSANVSIFFSQMEFIPKEQNSFSTRANRKLNILQTQKST